MPRSADDVLKEIRGLIAERPWAEQPLYRALMTEKLTQPELRYFAKQYSVYALHNHHYHGNIYVQCPDPVWRQRIAEVVYEEGTGRLFANGVAHSQLWLLFSDAVGVPREEMFNVEFCPGALAKRVYTEWVCKRSFLEGMSGSSLAGEAQAPGAYAKIARNLQRQNGLSAEAVSFFDVHDVADADHGSAGAELLEHFAKTQTDYELVLRTVRDYLGIERLMNEDIYRHMKELA